MAEIRECIRDIVLDIPLTLSKAEQYLGIFEESPKLHENTAALYVAVLDTLEAVVQEFRKHTARKYRRHDCFYVRELLTRDSRPD